MKKFIKILKENTPDEIKKFYIVGGYVRDLYLNQDTFNDIDVIWPIDAQEIEKYLKKRFLVKKKTKTYATSLYHNGKKFLVEISPLKSHSIEEDLLSRDLTINSIALLVSKQDNEVRWVDPSGGIEDLTYQILRSIREENLVEDPLRMLRVFRFQSKLKFEIDNYTFACIRRNRQLIKRVPKEMIYSELMKIFQYQYCEVAIRNMTNAGILQEIIPEIVQVTTFRHQDKFHKYETVFEHSMRVLRNCKLKRLPIEYNLAALFHDIKKPSVYDGKHYLYHEIKSAVSTREILKELKFPNKMITHISDIVENHMIPMDSRKKLIEMRYKLGKDRFQKEIEFIHADKMATHSDWLQSEMCRVFKALTNEVLGYDPFFSRIDTMINGDIIIALGIKPSIGIKYILNYLRNFFFKKPELLSEEKVHELLKLNLKYETDYRQLKMKKKTYKRKYEYIRENKIYGLLEKGEKLTFKTGIFEFIYLSKGEFEPWLSKNKKECSLFFL